ncbi:uncharacterized protein LOC130647044 [Hydractinia symbiolongicarpus]|uniref:uncharacterized protein LOC130647044 n=1 Tax=Hydractinia symbiolongicarpus TaxID=13093 RepID=UPI00254C0560|nr:uncharacterized protein LOC130647044 [Hydractinia symbiolongicarpus]
MSEEQRKAVAAIIIATTLLPTNFSKPKVTRRIRVKEWMKKRKSIGVYDNLVQELRLYDEESFRKYLRMSPDIYELLLEKVRSKLTKKTTHLRKPLEPELKLTITLRFLATGENFTSLHHHYSVGISTIATFIPQVCQALYDTLKDDFLKFPENKDDWLEIASEFETMWQFPNCIGGMDGNHIALYHPKLSGSTYYNYKGFFSLVLLGIIDARYRFIFVDIGCQGRLSDGGVFRRCEFFRGLSTNSIDLPERRKLPNISGIDDSFLNPECDQPLLPYVLVADDAFPLTEYCMKPYAQKGLTESKRIFNYRLSRARRTSENAFGILVNRFRCLTAKLNVLPESAVKVTLATCALHNMLCTMSMQTYTNAEGPEIKDNIFNNLSSLSPMEGTKSRNFSTRAENIRNSFSDYFQGIGQVHWQWNQVYGQ